MEDIVLQMEIGDGGMRDMNGEWWWRAWYEWIAVMEGYKIRKESGDGERDMIGYWCSIQIESGGHFRVLKFSSKLLYPYHSFLT